VNEWNVVRLDNGVLPTEVTIGPLSHLNRWVAVLSYLVIFVEKSEAWVLGLEDQIGDLENVSLLYIPPVLFL